MSSKIQFFSLKKQQELGRGIGVLAAYKEGDRAWNSEIVWEHSRINLFAWDGFVQT